MNAFSTGPSAIRVALVWAALSVLGVVLAMPFLLALLDGLNAPNRPPWPVLMLALVVQTGVGAFFLSWAGTATGRQLGVGSPFVEAWLSGQRKRLPRTFLGAMGLGFGSGLIVLMLSAVIDPYMPPLLRDKLPEPTPFHGLLASFYGGISEEILMRLGVGTLVAWLVSKIVGIEGRKRIVALSVGVLISALVFGAAHMPMAMTLWPPTPIVIARILLLNAIVGVLAGAIYVRHGIEHAIAMHFSADVAIYVIAPIARDIVNG